MVIHPIEPVFDRDSRVLILGSFPSVKSRDEQFFYAHPRNRFWQVLASILDQPQPETVSQKREFLLRYRIALWDVIGSCEVSGSSDSSIKNVRPNDLSLITETADIRAIYLNGKTAWKYYDQYFRDTIDINAVCLPSTSPANASWNLERLTEAWSVIRLDF